MQYQSDAKRERVPQTEEVAASESCFNKGRNKEKRRRRKEKGKDGKAFRSPRRITTVLLLPLLSSFSAKYLSSRLLSRLCAPPPCIS